MFKISQRQGWPFRCNLSLSRSTHSFLFSSSLLPFINIYKLCFQVFYFYKYMLLDPFYLRLVWVMHEWRKLKNSKAVFTQRPGKTWALAHLVSSTSPQHPRQCPASHRANFHLKCTGQVETGTTKQEREKFLPETLMTLNNLQPAIRYQHVPSNLKAGGKVSITFACIPTVILSYNTLVRYQRFAVRLQTPRFLLYFSRFWLRAFDNLHWATIIWHDSHHNWQQLFYISSQNYLLLPCKYYIYQYRKFSHGVYFKKFFPSKNIFSKSEIFLKVLLL